MAQKLYHGSPKKLSRLTPSADGNVYATEAINEAAMYARKADWKNWPAKRYYVNGEPVVDSITKEAVKIVNPNKGPARIPWRRTYGFMHEIDASKMPNVLKSTVIPDSHLADLAAQKKGYAYNKAQSVLYPLPIGTSKENVGTWLGTHHVAQGAVDVDKVSRLKYSRKQVPITKGEAAFAAGAVTAGAVGGAYYYRHRKNKIERVKKHRRI